MTISIIIPAYNEERTIATILTKIINCNIQNATIKEIIIVNDASTDNTIEEIKKWTAIHADVNLSIINHTKNQGKGAALHKGISAATSDITLIQDADLEYDPREYSILTTPITEGHADVVYGSRFMGGRPHRILFFWHSIGNKLLTMLSNWATNLNLTDMETCYKAFLTHHLQALKLKEKRFGFEPEVTAKISRIPNIRIYEVGISYYGRTFDEGKKINWKDGFRAIYCIIKYAIVK